MNFSIALNFSAISAKRVSKSFFSPFRRSFFKLGVLRLRLPFLSLISLLGKITENSPLRASTGSVFSVRVVFISPV